KEFNRIHRQGYGNGDYSEIDGRDFFTGGDTEDPASQIAVYTLDLNDLDAVSVAISTNASGANIIANELVRIAESPFLEEGRTTFSQAYDKMVGRVGIDSMRSKEEVDATKIVAGQLAAQKEGISGVSLDEEAANLLKYQQLFQASSRLITTVD